MNPTFNKGTKVSWTTTNGADVEPTRGHGVCVADSDGTHVLVAVVSDGEKHYASPSLSSLVPRSNRGPHRLLNLFSPSHRYMTLLETPRLSAAAGTLPS
jgi:hypothetical protein